MYKCICKWCFFTKKYDLLINELKKYIIPVKVLIFFLWPLYFLAGPPLKMNNDRSLTAWNLHISYQNSPYLFNIGNFVTYKEIFYLNSQNTFNLKQIRFSDINIYHKVLVNCGCKWTYQLRHLLNILIVICVYVWWKIFEEYITGKNATQVVMSTCV